MNNFEEVNLESKGIRNFITTDSDRRGSFAVYTAGKTIAWEYSGASVRSLAGTVENGAVVITDHTAGLKRYDGRVSDKDIMQDVCMVMNLFNRFFPEYNIDKSKHYTATTLSDGEDVSFTDNDVVEGTTLIGTRWFRVGKLYIVVKESKLKGYRISISENKILPKGIVLKDVSDFSPVLESELNEHDKQYCISALKAVFHRQRNFNS